MATTETVQWTEEEVTVPLRKAAMDCGNTRLVVTEEQTGRTWRYFQLSISGFVTDSFSDCLATWPREAIRTAREELDKLESMLETE